MTGAEHFREAEREVERARTADFGEPTAYHLGMAQAHATLALAAAFLADLDQRTRDGST